jgi:phospholipase A1
VLAIANFAAKTTKHQTLMLKRFVLIILFTITLTQTLSAQIVSKAESTFDADSIRRDFRDQPYFGLYKDNYFVFGPSIGHTPTRQNTNVKFQISIAQRLTRATLLGGSYLYLFYSQKCFWNVLEESLPMTDLNFNPGIGLTRPLFVKNKFIGKLTFILEHESNGRDGDESRSWNKISVAANVIVDHNLMIHGKAWIPIIDGQNNKDILDYSGIYQMGMQMLSSNNRFCGGITLVKRRGWNLNYNTIVDLAYRISRKDNQFLFLQYYNGYGEGLLEYNKFHSQLRVGILIRPKLFSDF